MKWSGGYRRMVAAMADLGFSGTMKAIWNDLFANRSFCPVALPASFRKFSNLAGVDL